MSYWYSCHFITTPTHIILLNTRSYGVSDPKLLALVNGWYLYIYIYVQLKLKNIADLWPQVWSCVPVTFEDGGGEEGKSRTPGFLRVWDESYFLVTFIQIFYIKMLPTIVRFPFIIHFVWLCYPQTATWKKNGKFHLKYMRQQMLIVSNLSMFGKKW